MCRYEFDVPGEVIQSLACHPSQPDVAVGFANGRIRVFHVPTTTLIQEHQLHRGGVMQVGCISRNDRARRIASPWFHCPQVGCKGSLCMLRCERNHVHELTNVAQRHAHAQL